MGAIILAGAVAAVAPFFLEEQARPLADDLLVELPARPFSFAKSNQETRVDPGSVLDESSKDKILAASADTAEPKNGAAGESNIPSVSEPIAPAPTTTETLVAAPTAPVKASTAPTTTPTTRQLMVQLGAYATAEAANRVKSRLEAGGNRVVVETTTNAEGLTRHRVRIGPFKTREEAIEVRDRAKVQGYDAALVRS